MSALFQAILEIQKDRPHIKKDKKNPGFKNAPYSSLDEVLEKCVKACNDHGIAVVQKPTHVDGHPALTTKLAHAESGEVEEGTMLLLLSKMDPQGQGSGITYARRYGLLSMLGLNGDEDDDANSASEPKAQKMTPNWKRQLTLAYRGLEAVVGEDAAKQFTADTLREKGAKGFDDLDDAGASAVFNHLEEYRLQQVEGVPT